MFSESLIPVRRVQQVFGVRVVLLECLGPVQEEIQEHRVGHQFGDLADGLLLDFEPREPPQELQHDEQDGRPRAERRRQELRSQDGGVPVRSGCETVVEKGCHGVDADGHGNRQQDQRHDDAGVVGSAAEGTIQNVCDDREVDEEVEIQNQDVPRQDRLRKVQVAPGWEQVPEAVRPADVHQHEQQAHHDSAHGKQFAVHHDFTNGLPVVDVRGDDQHHGGGGHPNQEREVPDVEAPAHLVPHGRDRQTGLHLGRIRRHPRRDERNQEGHPRPVGARAEQDQPDAAGDERGEQANGPHGHLTWRRSRRTSARCSDPASARAPACAR